MHGQRIGRRHRQGWSLGRLARRAQASGCAQFCAYGRLRGEAKVRKGQTEGRRMVRCMTVGSATEAPQRPATNGQPPGIHDRALCICTAPALELDVSAEDPGEERRMKFVGVQVEERSNLTHSRVTEMRQRFVMAILTGPGFTG